MTQISETRSKIFILDISGLPTADFDVGNQLIKITKAAKLLGCDSIISGISPAIALILTELGINVGEVHTTATLRDALAISLRRLGALNQ